MSDSLSYIAAAVLLVVVAALGLAVVYAQRKGESSAAENVSTQRQARCGKPISSIRPAHS